MATTKRDGLPYFYATGLSKILVGEQPCRFESWIKGHFQIAKVPSSSNVAQWKLDHTSLLTREVDRLKAAGWRVTVEQFFRLTGKHAILGGKPDIIALKDGHRPKIVDAKAGRFVGDAHVAQVLLYMIAIPMAWGREMTFEGEVAYVDHTVKITAQEAESFRPKLFALLRSLASETAPDPMPSESACRFCDVTQADCPKRWTAEPVEMLTSEF